MSQSDSPSVGSVEAQNGDAEGESDSSYESSLQLPSLTPSPTRYSSPETVVHASDDNPTTSIKPAGVPLPPSPELASESPSSAACTPLHHVNEASPYPPWPELAASGNAVEDRDNITDTVGAIAIDHYGNIACGASSGGIGLKFRGRVGPAALNGIGSYVLPMDPDDKNKTTVACVTSGTGETIGTTMAAAICSQRLYDGVRKTKGGGTEQCDDEDVLKAFIEKDFMGKY
jgi:taspase (threonine aspartase 1)